TAAFSAPLAVCRVRAHRGRACNLDHAMNRGMNRTTLNALHKSEPDACNCHQFCGIFMRLRGDTIHISNDKLLGEDSNEATSTQAERIRGGLCHGASADAGRQ